MTEQNSESRRSAARAWWRRRSLDVKIFLLLGILAVVLAPAGWFGVRPALLRWKQDRLLATARGAAERGDSAALDLALKQFATTPGGPAAAWAEAAALSEDRGARAATSLWREALRRDPRNTAYAVYYLRAALRAGDLSAAERVITNASPELRAAPGYSALLGRFQLQTANPQAAVTAFERALVEEPDRADLQLDYGALLAESDDPNRRTRGVALLERAAGSAETRLAALRVLFDHDLRARWFYSAQRRLAELEHAPGVAFPDHLRALDLALARDGSIDAARVEEVARRAVRPEDATALGDWLLAHGFVDEAEVVANAAAANPALSGAANRLRLWIAVRRQDWAAVAAISRDALGNGKVGEALAAAQTERDQLAHPSEWRSPLDIAAGDPIALEVLRGYYEAARMPERERPVVQAQIGLEPSNRAHWFRLIAVCRQTRDSAMLRRVIAELAAATGNPPDLAGDVLTLDLLTARSTAAEVLPQARALRERQPASPGAANAEAFALASMGDGVAAVAIYRQFPDSAWTAPWRLALVGYAFAQAGDHVRAEQFFTAAEEHRDELLLEHQVLIRKARSAWTSTPMP